MSYAISEPLGEPQDEADQAAERAEAERAVALRNHAARVEIGEDQWIDGEGRALCLWCGEPIEPERLAAAPWAVRHQECEADWERFQRRQQQ